MKMPIYQIIEAIQEHDEDICPIIDDLTNEERIELRTLAEQIGIEMLPSNLFYNKQEMYWVE